MCVTSPFWRLNLYKAQTSSHELPITLRVLGVQVPRLVLVVTLPFVGYFWVITFLFGEPFGASSVRAFCVSVPSDWPSGH